MEFVDIHTHTLYSDGTASVPTLLRHANDAGLSLLAVTDHNTVSAYDELLDKRSSFSGQILPGVELTTVYQNELIEFLGYGIDVSAMHRLIQKNYLSFREKQIKEAALDVTAVLKAGAVLSDAFVRTMLESPEQIFDPSRETNRPYLLAELKRHSENAVFFEDRNEFEKIDPNRFSRKYLFHHKSRLYSDQSSLFPRPQDVVDMIHQCGGLVFLAHPLVYETDLTTHPEEWLTLGVDGVECLYGTFDDAQQAALLRLCERYGRYKSGGSDFHGLDMRPQNHIGLANRKPIPKELIDPWLPLVEKRIF